MVWKKGGVQQCRSTIVLKLKMYSNRDKNLVAILRKNVLLGSKTESTILQSNLTTYDVNYQKKYNVARGDF